MKAFGRWLELRHCETGLWRELQRALRSNLRLKLRFVLCPALYCAWCSSVELPLLLLRGESLETFAWFDRVDGQRAGTISILICDCQQRVLPLWHERQFDQVSLRCDGKSEREAEELVGVSGIGKIA